MGRSLKTAVRSFRFAWSSLFGHDVFISYARKESRGLARRIELELKRRGFTVFRDYSGLIGGDHYRVILRNAAARCRLHVLLLGEQAVASEWVNREVRARWAYARLMRRRGRKRRSSHPFFPVFDQGLDWNKAPSHLLKTREFHGFPINRPGREVSEWDPLAIAGAVDHAFKGWRARILWRTTGLGILAAIVFFAGLAGWLRLSAMWQQESLTWQVIAESAEADKRFLEAEMAWARAAKADPRMREILTPRYLGAREQRMVTPVWTLPTNHMRLRWVGESGGQPVLALVNNDSTRMTFRRQDGLSVSLSCHEEGSSRFRQAGDRIVALVGNSLWLIDLEAPLDSRVQKMSHGMNMGVWRPGFDHPDIRIKDGQLHMLGLDEGTPTLLRVDLHDWREIERVVLENAGMSQAIRLSETTRWLAIGAELNATSRIPAIVLLAWEHAGKRSTLRAGIRLPEDFSPGLVSLMNIIPSLDDQQMFLALDGRRIEDLYSGLPRQTNTEGDFWFSVDIDTRRPSTTLGRGVFNLKALYAWNNIEAAYDDGDGELRLLTWDGPPILNRQSRSAAPRTHSWALLDPGKGMRESASIASIQDSGLVLHHGLNAILRVVVPQIDPQRQSIRLKSSADGSWMVMELRPDDPSIPGTLFVWKVGIPAMTSTIPPIIDLERALQNTAK